MIGTHSLTLATLVVAGLPEVVHGMLHASVSMEACAEPIKEPDPEMNRTFNSKCHLSARLIFACGHARLYMLPSLSSLPDAGGCSSYDCASTNTPHPKHCLKTLPNLHCVFALIYTTFCTKSVLLRWQKTSRLQVCNHVHFVTNYNLLPPKLA